MNTRYFILNYSPAAYAAVMGIGIAGGLLYEFPYKARWLEVCGIIFWAVALGLFALSTIIMILRLFIFPSQFHKMSRHIGQSAFLGCIPMGFATIINMVHYIWGEKSWRATYAMWWIDVAMSLASAWIVVFAMFAYHERAIESTNATILLPVVALVVAAATGFLICNNLPNHLQKMTATISLMMWGNGQAVAFAFTTVYLNRLLLGKLPPRAIMISNFLPIGPLGQGAFGIMNMSQLDIFGSYQREVSVFSTAIAVIMLGYASFWMFIAFCASIFHPPKQFHMSFWGLTFPLGTYASACYKVGIYLPAFKPIGCAVTVFVVLAALFCTAFSLYQMPLVLSQVDNETGGLTIKKDTDHASTEGTLGDVV